VYLLDWCNRAYYCVVNFTARSDLQLNQATKIVGGAVLTVVLGAIGSGVWERLLSPAWAWVVRGALTVITLGIDSASDAIYATVAKGHTERYSLLTYVFINMIMVAIPVLGLLYRRMENSEKLAEEDERWDAMCAAGDEAGLDSMRAERHSKLARLQTMLGGVLWLLLLLSAWNFTNSVSLVYANGAISHFNQSLMIVGPYMSVVEEKEMKSDFARIATKADYVRLIQSIEGKASEHGVKLPKFTVW
jgi:hypothetical protein